VRREAQKQVPLDDQTIADLTASFEAAACASVIDRVRLAHRIAVADPLDDDQRTSSQCHSLPIVIAGGVAANQRLRGALTMLAAELDTKAVYPPPALCTDNGAMIAWAGAEHFIRGHISPSNVGARARWPLDEDAAPIIGKGKHGPKA